MTGVDAATCLFEYADNEETKNVARETLYLVLRNPEAYYKAASSEAFEDQLLVKLKTAVSLIKKGNEKDKLEGEGAIQDHQRGDEPG